jgi:hypothetical protein
VPLYNNPVVTRLKMGDTAGAGEDCSAVIGIVGVGYRLCGRGKECGEGVELAEGLVEVLKRGGGMGGVGEGGEGLGGSC